MGHSTGTALFDAETEKRPHRAFTQCDRDSFFPAWRRMDNGFWIIPYPLRLSAGDFEWSVVHSDVVEIRGIILCVLVRIYTSLKNHENRLVKQVCGIFRSSIIYVNFSNI